MSKETNKSRKGSIAKLVKIWGCFFIVDFKKSLVCYNIFIILSITRIMNYYIKSSKTNLTGEPILKEVIFEVGIGFLLRRCSTLFIIKELQTKTMIYYYTTIKVVEYQTMTTPNTGQNMEQYKFS